MAPTTPAIDCEIRRLLRDARNASTNDWLESLTQGLKDSGLAKARLGFDDLEVAEALKDRYLPDLRARGAGNLFWQIRLVKTPQEVAVMRKGAEIHQEAVGEALSIARKGLDVAEISRAFQMALVKRGALPGGRGGFGTGPAERSLYQHLHHPLKAGDILAATTQSKHRGYTSETGRTLVIGRPSPRQAATYSALVAAFDRLDSVITPGISTSQVFNHVAGAVSQHGGDAGKLGTYCHSIGLDVLELPHHARSQGFTLEPNVCLCVYVLYREPEAGQIYGIEDQYLVTDQGCERFSTYSRELMEVA